MFYIVVSVHRFPEVDGGGDLTKQLLVGVLHRAWIASISRRNYIPNALVQQLPEDAAH